MKTRVTLLAVSALLWGVAECAYAQKGMGEPSGIARQAVKPEVVSLSGKVLAIKTGPCEATTGRATIGAHFLLETSKGKELNIHLGPAAVVNYVVRQLPIGKKVTVDAFRTAKMPENHYVAQALAFAGKSIQLRDQSLQPFWAQGNAVSRGRGNPQLGPGNVRGPGYGRGRGGGPGYGRGPASGRGYGPGLGPAYGRGTGRGQGAAYGRGYGHGYGRGPASYRGYGPVFGPGYGRGAARGQGAGYGRGLGRQWGFVDRDQDGICDNF